LKDESSAAAREEMETQERTVSSSHSKFKKINRSAPGGPIEHMVDAPAHNNASFDAALNTFTHTDGTEFAMQVYFGSFDERIVVLPGLCLAVRLLPGDMMILKSKEFLHSSLSDKNGVCMLVATFNSPL